MSITIYAKNKHGYILESKAEAFTFPGGENHLRIPEDETPWGVQVNGADLNELVIAGLVADWAKQVGATVRLVLPYLPAARADRGIPFAGRVYADIINSFGFDQVITFDPHSAAVPALINNLTVLDAATVLSHVLTRDEDATQYTALICPDEGAEPRVAAVAGALGLPVVHARKKRDFATGKLSGFTCEELPDPNGTYLVVDDICDGGGTFMGLAEATGLAKDQLHLWVSHGVFSTRAPQLRDAYAKVITTTSHPGHTNPDVAAQIVHLTPYLMGEVI